MPRPHITLRLGALALCAFGLGLSALSAADAPNGAADQKKNASAAAKEKSKASLDLHDLLKQLAEERDTLIANHESLQKQLKDATEAQKKAILEKMEAQKKAFAEVTSALQKQIADERRSQRKGTAPKR